MIIIKKNMMLDDVLATWQEALGADFNAYHNHCYRVLNFYAALIAKTVINIDKGAIAIAFHDIGIWTQKTFDYLAPSEQLAREYLTAESHPNWIDEIITMIANHHKVTAYRGDPLVEAMRKADWIDVSLGLRRFGLDKSFVASVQMEFPNEGFHQRLVKLSAKHTAANVFHPLPMIKW